jgi:hypothetical protein
MFGMASLIVDPGYGFGPERAMQNGADAGAMAATKAMAGSIEQRNLGLVVADWIGPIDDEVAFEAIGERLP